MNETELLSDRRSINGKIQMAKINAARKQKDKLKDSDLVISVRGKKKPVEVEETKSNDSEMFRRAVELETENRLLKQKIEKAKKRKASVKKSEPAVQPKVEEKKPEPTPQIQQPAVPPVRRSVINL